MFVFNCIAGLTKPILYSYLIEVVVKEVYVYNAERIGVLLMNESKYFNIKASHKEITVEYILNRAYNYLRRPITLLGISPINEVIVESALDAAKNLKAPMMFISSLNQIDIDGGYTGWTPEQFMRYVNLKIRELRASIPVIMALDHGGPWLKDKHIFENMSYEEALEATKKSLEAFIVAGYRVLHIDTTVDPTVNKPPSPDVVAKRTVELIEFAEEIRKDKGLSPISYEIGSDRWEVKDIYYVKDLLSRVLNGLREKGLRVRIVFIVGDVGTRVSPGNKLNVNKALNLVKLAEHYNLYLKIHSADYIENPSILPKIRVGGANMGPMFADLMFQIIRDILRKHGSEDLTEEYFINIIINEIIKDGRWRKYVKSPSELFKLIGTSEEYKLGLMTRYVWNSKAVKDYLNEIFSNLCIEGINGKTYVKKRISSSIKYYLRCFNLTNIAREI